MNEYYVKCVDSDLSSIRDVDYLGLYYGDLNWLYGRYTEPALWHNGHYLAVI